MSTCFTTSPVSALMSDDRVVRMTAQQFKRNFHEKISNALFVEKVLHDSATYVVEMHRATGGDRYERALNGWIAEAKRIHRYERRFIANQIRRTRFLPMSLKIARFVKKAKHWQWKNRDEALATIRTMSWREFDIIYNRDDNPSDLQIGQPPTISDYQCAGYHQFFYTKSEAKEAQALLAQAKEVLDIANTHPTGTMVYLPVRLMNAIMKLETTVVDIYVESIRRLDAILDDIEPKDQLDKKRFLHYVEKQPSLIPTA